MSSSIFDSFVPTIASLPAREPLTKDDLLIPALGLGSEGNLQVYYAPFDYVNENARIALIGITPGWTQMEIAYRRARQDLLNGLTPVEICRRAKEEGRFAGSMRKNLISMLDALELPFYLGIESCDSLFGSHGELLHSTSAIRYPVFVDGQNYTGHSPRILRSELLRGYIFEVLKVELEKLTKALIVPLGKGVSDAVQALIGAGLLDRDRCCMGFPHPSGANSHRLRQFSELEDKIKPVLKSWFQ
jgi:hypothetical protein